MYVFFFFFFLFLFLYFILAGTARYLDNVFICHTQCSHNYWHCGNFDFLKKFYWLVSTFTYFITLYFFIFLFYHFFFDLLLYLFYFFACFTHQRLTDSFSQESPRVSKTLFSVQADLNKAVIWMASILPLISNSSSLFSQP